MQTLNIKTFEDELRQKKHIIIYIFRGYPIEIPAQIPREKSKKKFRRRFRKGTIYTANTSKSTLPIKYSKYTDVFSENKINNTPPMARTKYSINFEENSIILYKSIYHFSEKIINCLKTILHRK
jgi:hypothetical protein